MKNNSLAMHVSLVTITVNIILSAFKAIAGFVSGSAAMLSDAVHSASDVFSTIIVMIGVKAANKTADKKHPYGHERMECVASVVLALALFVTGIGIGAGAVKSLVYKNYATNEKIKLIALVAAIVSIVVKEWMFWYTRSAAKKTNSTALMADAWHHRSDALSSVGALIGIGLSVAGYPIFDPIASIVICILIIKVAIDVFFGSK